MASIDSEQDISADTILAGRYQVQSLVGSGGMASVYRATDLVLQREVALKVMRRAVSAEATVVKRFVKEAQRMASLDSPYVVPIYDVGKDGPHVFLVMKLLAGKTLEDLIVASGRLPPERAVPLCAQLLEGLAHLHARSLVHRDVKPSNLVVLEGDRAVLLDLGIARSASGGLAPHNRGTDPNLHRGKTTEEQLLMGTPEYMSPERVLDKPVDARSDVYSVGITLYEALTGQVPFLGATPIEVCLKQMNEPPRPPSAVCPDVNAELEAVLLRALAKDPAQRYQTATEMREALLDWSYGRTSARAVAGDLEAHLLPIDMETADAHSQAELEFGAGILEMDASLNPTDASPSRGSNPIPPVPGSLEPASPRGATPPPLSLRSSGPAPAWNGVSATLETAGAAPYIPPGTPTERIPSPDIAGASFRPGGASAASRTARAMEQEPAGGASLSLSGALLEESGSRGTSRSGASSDGWRVLDRRRRWPTLVALAAGTGLGAFALLALPRLNHSSLPAPDEFTAGRQASASAGRPDAAALVPAPDSASAPAPVPAPVPTLVASGPASAPGKAGQAGSSQPPAAAPQASAAGEETRTSTTHTAASSPSAPAGHAASGTEAHVGMHARARDTVPVPDARGSSASRSVPGSSSPGLSSSPEASSPSALSPTGSSGDIGIPGASSLPADSAPAGGHHPDSTDPLVQARARLAAGDTVDALKLLDAALAQSPGRPEAYRLRGDTFFRIGNTGAAIAAYRKYLSLAPDAPDAPAVRARLSGLGGL